MDSVPFVFPAADVLDRSRKKCKHGVNKSLCSECGGAALCVHGKQKYSCKKCVHPSKLCILHNNFKHSCRKCTHEDKKSYATVVVEYDKNRQLLPVDDQKSELVASKPLNLIKYILGVTGEQTSEDASDLSYLYRDESSQFASDLSFLDYT